MRLYLLQTYLMVSERQIVNEIELHSPLVRTSIINGEFPSARRWLAVNKVRLIKIFSIDSSTFVRKIM